MSNLLFDIRLKLGMWLTRLGYLVYPKEARELHNTLERAFKNDKEQDKQVV